MEVFKTKLTILHVVPVVPEIFEGPTKITRRFKLLVTKFFILHLQMSSPLKKTQR